jgi:hypothetical protein
MSQSDRLGAFESAWHQFQWVDARLDAIFAKYRPGAVDAASPLLVDGAISPSDKAEVAWLQAEISCLAPTLAAVRLPKSAPLMQSTEKQIFQTYRLAGWPLERRRECCDWGKSVVDRLRGVDPALEATFDHAFAARP